MYMIDFDIEEEGSEKLTQELILANATFDIKEVLSDKTSIWCSAVSILTQSQTVNCAFLAQIIDNGDHASIADLMLSRIYPEYHRQVDQEIYEREKNNNIFILTIDNRLIIPYVTRNTTLTYSQFKGLSKLLNDVKDADYCKKTDSKTGKVHFDKIILGNRPYSIDQIDLLLSSLREKIYDKRPVNQYRFNYDFSKCQNDEEYRKQARLYAEQHSSEGNLLYKMEGR